MGDERDRLLCSSPAQVPHYTEPITVVLLETSLRATRQRSEGWRRLGSSMFREQSLVIGEKEREEKPQTRGRHETMRAAEDCEEDCAGHFERREGTDQSVASKNNSP